MKFIAIFREARRVNTHMNSTSHGISVGRMYHTNYNTEVRGVKGVLRLRYKYVRKTYIRVN